jgi:hypothetical protein
MKTALILLSCAALLFGCAAKTKIAKEALGEDPINVYRITCSKPYKLTQDCSFWTGAARDIAINGLEIKICGNDGGDVVVVMDGNATANYFKEFFTLNHENYHSDGTNNSFEAVKKVLLKAGVEIYRVRVIYNPQGIDGYVLELSSDGYSLLKKYSIKKT